MKLSCSFPPCYIKRKTSGLFRLVARRPSNHRDKDESCHSFTMLGHFNRSPVCRLVFHFFFYLTSILLLDQASLHNTFTLTAVFTPSTWGPRLIINAPFGLSLKARWPRLVSTPSPTNHWLSMIVLWNICKTFGLSVLCKACTTASEILANCTPVSPVR